MSKRRKIILACTILALIGCNGLLWLIDIGIRVKGPVYNMTQTADAIIHELESRDLLVDASVVDDHQVYFDTFVYPIEEHMKPYESAAIVPITFNLAALVLVLLFLLLPERKKVEPVH